MVYIVMSFAWAVQAVKYLRNNQISQKVTKKSKKPLISPGKIKNENNKNEIKMRMRLYILALLIGQEAVLSL